MSYFKWILTLISLFFKIKYADLSEVLAKENANAEAITNEVTVVETELTNELFSESQLNLNLYRYEEPHGFTIGIIVNPCLGKGAACCIDSYGTPTYIVPGTIKDSSTGTASLVDAYNNSLSVIVSRLADSGVTFDFQCGEDNIGAFRYVNNAKDYSDPLCKGNLMAMAGHLDHAFPPCWDRNASVNATSTCFAPDGTLKTFCVAVAYTQTAFIIQCGKEFSLDNHCGTFLEIHVPGDETILSQTRLLSEYPSGYRSTTLPLFYGKDKKKTICQGDYEIWWVLRTRSNFVVQFKKTFFVSFPECDYRPSDNVYFPYYTIPS